MPRFLLDPGFLHFTLGFLSGFPGFFDKGESLLEGGGGCFPRWLVYLRGVSYEEIKRGFLRRCGWPGVLGVLCEGEPCVPVILLSSAEYSEVLF